MWNVFISAFTLLWLHLYRRDNFFSDHGACFDCCSCSDVDARSAQAVGLNFSNVYRRGMANVALDFHQQQLAVRCRVCGRKRDVGRTHKSVDGIAFELISVLGIDVRCDEVDRHPTKLCSGCWKFVQRRTSAGPSDRLPQTALQPQRSDWLRCAGDSCVLCCQWKLESRGGRGKKLKNIRGRPAGARSKETEGDVDSAGDPVAVEFPVPDKPAIAARLHSLAFDLPLDVERFVDIVGEQFQCPICKQVLNRPMAVPVPGCDHACCFGCWKEWLPNSATCPVCRDNVAVTDLQPLPRGLWDQLQSLRVHCDYWQNGCPAIVELGQLCRHAKECAHKASSGAFEVSSVIPCPKLTTRPSVADLRAPAKRPVSNMESRLACDIIRRLSHERQSEVSLPLHTGGRPLHVSITPVASSSPCEDASERTERRRRHFLQEIEKTVSGSAAARQLEPAKVRHVSPAESMAMAVNLRLTNDQLRKLRRWTKQWSVSLASERKTCLYVNEQMGDVELGSEMVQGVTTDQDNGRCLMPAAFAWVKNPIALLCRHLQSLRDRRLLTWHNRPSGLGLPEKEIWLKVGGDKGGGSFKFAMQVVNQHCPNSPDHTVVLACLEADDNLPNLHVALDSFQPFISKLQGMSWE